MNKTAAQAGVVGLADDPTWRLVVDGAVAHELSLSRADLAAMPQHEAELPIACVEGWSASASWRGVPVRDLLARAGAAPGATAVVHSVQTGASYTRSELDRFEVNDKDTLLATHLGGAELHPDHGFPLRLIAPNRPGVHQTKWIARLEVI